MKKIILGLLVLALTSISCKKDIDSETAGSQTDSISATEHDTVLLNRYFKWQKTKSYSNYNLSERDTMVLSRLEKIHDTLTINNFITKNDTLKEYPYTPQDMIRHLYTIDIDGDQRNDLIYEGPSGAEPFILHIFMNKPEGFVKVFTKYQYLEHPVFKDSKLVSFSVQNPGCCADPQILEHFYDVNYDNNIPSFNLTKSIGFIDYMQKPDKKFAQEKSFSITTPDAQLRSECYIFNIEHPAMGPHGNEVSAYNKGHKGKAIGYALEDGKEWLYVFMDPTIPINNYDSFYAQPTYLYGWILKSDTDLK